MRDMVPVFGVVYDPQMGDSWSPFCNSSGCFRLAPSVPRRIDHTGAAREKAENSEAA